MVTRIRYLLVVLIIVTVAVENTAKKCKGAGKVSNGEAITSPTQQASTLKLAELLRSPEKEMLMDVKLTGAEGAYDNLQMQKGVKLPGAEGSYANLQMSKNVKLTGPEGANANFLSGKPMFVTGKAIDQDLVCSQEPIELGIVFDSSSSIKNADFTKGIEFLQGFLDQFEIGSGPKDVRVSIITFGKGVYPEDSFNLDTYTTKAEVIEAIGNVPHRSGRYTSTGEGIEYMTANQLAISQCRPGVPRIGIVITDGNSQEWRRTKAAAQAARDSGIKMFALGIGNVKRSEVNNIAGDPARVITVEDYGQLDSIKQVLVSQTCVKKAPSPKPQPVCHQDPIELGIVLDSSSSIKNADFATGIEFLQGFLDQFEIGSGPKDVRVSIITYGKGIYPKDSFNLDTYTTKAEVLEAIGNVPHRSGRYTSTGEGIEYMTANQLAASKCRRGVPRIGVVITDGNSQEWRRTKAAAQAARDSGIKMFALGIGNVKTSEVNNIAGDPSRVITVEGYSDLDSVKEVLASHTCT